MDNKKFKKAFTLAEVLMTLTIIGVIAAMTIPTLKNHSDEAALIAQTKKAYLIASNATSAAEAKYGDLELWDWGSNTDNKNTNSMNDKYKSVMSLAPNNSFSTYSVSLLSGDSWTTITPEKYFQTNDGMLWYMYNWSSGKDVGNSRIYGVIHVDVNGPKGPNVAGVDMHAFTVSSDGVTPTGDGIHDENRSWACTNYVIKYGKMPWYSNSSYTKCDDVYGK